jgi:hypothetical protein
MEVERNIELACLLTGSSTFKVAGWITRFAAVLSVGLSRPRHERQANRHQAKSVHAFLLRFTKLAGPTNFATPTEVRAGRGSLK